MPETGTIFLRKSKSVREVFFSSIGNMSSTCAALPAPALAQTAGSQSEALDGNVV